MQLVAYGVQDVYLTGNPQITYWKVIYKRHTNFAVEPIEQSWSGTADFGKSSVTSLIARNGDLMTKVYIKANVSISRKQGSTGNFAFVRRLGHAMIYTAELQIGGARIDLQYGDWMNIWYELAHEISQERGFAQMIGDTPYLTELSEGGQGSDQVGTKTGTLYVPMTFWFCRNNGLALPLIALQYHDVRINVNFNPASELVVVEQGTQVTAQITDSLLVIDYVFLDSEERKRFATSAHEYLIEQLQTPDQDTINQKNIKYRLPFNHPCKEIVWGIKLGKYITGQTFIAYHPTDFSAVRQRFASALFLLSLDATIDTDGKTITLHTTSSSQTYNEVSVFSSGVAASKAINDAVKMLRNSAVVVTKKADSDAEDPFSAANSLPWDFLSNPWPYIDFVDSAWESLSLDLISLPISSMGLSSSLPFLPYVAPFFVNVNQPFNYGLYLDGSVNLLSEANIQLNGQDRFTKRDGNYFNYVQPWQCHKNTPADGINVYSFALNPEEHQPSGTCNFSRIDFSQLNLTLTDVANAQLGDSSVIQIYTVNYNILRIMGKDANSFVLDFKIHTAHKSTQPVQSEILNWENLLVALVA